MRGLRRAGIAGMLISEQAGYQILLVLFLLCHEKLSRVYKFVADYEFIQVKKSRYFGAITFNGPAIK
jgi:hypothetical protein